MIRRAQEKDIPKILDLLSQVDMVHHNGRPDIFKIGSKYSDVQLKEIFKDEKRPVLVYTDDETEEVVGYCFCIYRQHIENPILTDIKTLYIDDLCVDENMRGKHVGKALYEAARELAKRSGCYNLTLNVWACNTSAIGFYERQGLSVQKTEMELIL